MVKNCNQKMYYPYLFVMVVLQAPKNKSVFYTNYQSLYTVV